MGTKPMTVGDLMTDRVFSLSPQDNLGDALELMFEHDIRHVPVIDHDQILVGVISQRDVARSRGRGDARLPISAQEDLWRSVRLREIMTRDLETAEIGDDIRLAARTMFEGKYSCLPVVDEGRHVVGILTEADFVRLLAEGT